MGKYLPFSGNPNGRVFGRLGETIYTDEGKSYFKANYDTMNVGWVEITPTATPTSTPTPTPTPTPFLPYSP